MHLMHERSKDTNSQHSIDLVHSWSFRFRRVKLFNHATRRSNIPVTLYRYIYLGFLITFLPLLSYAHISADEAWGGFVTERSFGRVSTLVEYVAFLANDEAFSDSPEHARFKNESLQYFLTTGGPNGFLKPEEDKRSEEQKRADRKTLKNAAVYIGVVAGQKEKTLDIFAVRDFYAKSPIPVSVQKHLEILQLIVSSTMIISSALSGALHQKASSEGDMKERSAISEATHPLFKRYSSTQLSDILTPNFEGWVEAYQALWDIRGYLEPGLRFKALPIINTSPGTITSFSLKNGEVTWQESMDEGLPKSSPAFTPQSAQRRIDRIVLSKENFFFPGQNLGENTSLILEGDEIELPEVITRTKQFILLKPHRNRRVPLRAILLRRLMLQPYPIILNGYIDFNTSDGTIVEELAVTGCKVLLGFCDR